MIFKHAVLYTFPTKIVKASLSVSYFFRFKLTNRILLYRFIETVEKTYDSLFPESCIFPTGNID